MKTEKKPEISLERIVEAAIGLLNRDGLGRLTMRSLAAGLGIKAASLYWHVRNKQELMDQIAETLCREIRPSCGLKDPKAYLVEVAVLYRRALRGVRDSVAVFTRSRPATPARLELIKNTLICLLHLGVKEQNCMIAAHLFNNYVLSFAADEETIYAKAPDSPNPFAPILGTAHKPLSADKAFSLGLDVLFAGFKILK
jgi:AcrR family transcriptional regulator